MHRQFLPAASTPTTAAPANDGSSTCDSARRQPHDAARLVNAGFDAPLDEALKLEQRAYEALYDTADQKEGMRAFLEKRKPKFEGK